MYKDLLLALPSHPKTVSRAGLRKALAAAQLMEAHVTCVVTEPTLPQPVTLRAPSETFEREMKTRQADAHKTALAQLAAFEEEARSAGIAHEGRIVATPLDSVPDMFVEAARLRHLTLLPFIDGDEDCTGLVQALAFESGRPVLIVPDDGGEAFRLDKIVVAWDASRAAARAVGDALPLLRRAGEVRVVTVANDKEATGKDTRAEFVARLARDGVNATLEEVGRGRNSVGEALDAAAEGADLMVMGAFGHSRIRDFFLGGATRHVLARPRLPTLLSH